MILLGHLAKVQGLKGEFLLHDLMDDASRLATIPDLVIAPAADRLDQASAIQPPARKVTVRHFRWHQDRACVAFNEIPDRTAADPLKGWGLWMPDALQALPAGDSYRHDWVGCEIFLGSAKVGEVVRLEPTPMGYDMVVMRDLRPGRRGLREIPYIKAWWSLDLGAKRAEVDPPEGLLELDG
jgi:16S rRNA processing protein RimM